MSEAHAMMHVDNNYLNEPLYFPKNIQEYEGHIIKELTLDRRKCTVAMSLSKDKVTTNNNDNNNWTKVFTTAPKL